MLFVVDTSGNLFVMHETTKDTLGEKKLLLFVNAEMPNASY
jgi:hypothetical protein